MPQIDLKEVIIRLTGKGKRIHDVVAITSDGKEVPIDWRIENLGQVLTW